MNFIYSYWQEIQDGSVVVGKWIYLLYKLIVEGIESGEFVFSQKKANKAIKFIEKFVHHNKGPLAPGFLKLQLWQKALISIIFGVLNAEDGTRQFREICIILGRKMGKTLLAAGIMAYEAYLDGEFGSEIYCVAPKLDQSDLVFSAFQFTAEREFSDLTKKRKNDLFIEERNTTIKKIAFAEKKSDGYNPMLTIADEIAAWPGQKGLRQWEVMVSGTGARKEPLTIAISSGGYENAGIYDELFTRGTLFLLKNSKEKRFLPVFYIIDDPEKWDDINELYKSLPGLGVSVSVNFILDQIKIAYTSLSKLAEFKTKFCNLKQSSTTAWLPAEVVEAACCEPLKLEDFRGHYAVAGFDLSRTIDLTCATLAIEKNGLIYIFAHFWIPGNKLEEAMARDNLPYDIYIQRGFLSLSGENLIDYRDVFNWYVDIVKTYKIVPLVIGYDNYSASLLVHEMADYGFNMDWVKQGWNLTPVINEMDGLFRDHKILIGDNDLLKIHLLEVTKKENEESRCFLVKEKESSGKHVDGALAICDAMTVRQKWYGVYGAQLQN